MEFIFGTRMLPEIEQLEQLNPNHSETESFLQLRPHNKTPYKIMEVLLGSYPVPIILNLVRESKAKYDQQSTAVKL